MPSNASTYHAARVALATLHAKDRAIAKPLRQRLGIEVELVPGINTDLFGTFTGEIARAGTMADAARAKALAAITASGLPYGLGSEGSFGPDPQVPLIALATELMTFVDRYRGHEIRVSLRTHRTNFSSTSCRPGEDLTDFLTSARFPSHAVVVSPNESRGEPRFWKGIADPAALATAIGEACKLSADGQARVTTDMRAHMNPTRMVMIRRLARTLADRLATLCPACYTPGFGERDIERGLPCSDCGAPTDRPVAYLERCIACTFVRRVPLAGQTADARHCPHCNP
jgi:hypothetical protein